ncbi:MAG: class I SAM-dependent methyltransferase [Isosphaeraceae bacterium]
MRRPSIVMTAALLALGVLKQSSSAQHASGSGKPAHYPAEMNKKFADPGANIEEFVRRFENDSRDVFAKRDLIVRAVGVRPSGAVADIGAGTGLFTHLFASQVGPKGTVYAVDIGSVFLRHIAQRAKRDGQDRVVKPVKNTSDSVALPPGSIDVAFLCDSYHHFDHPGKMLASIHRALRPGGRLILIDFDLRPGSSEYVKHRARAPREIYCREIECAGFEPIATAKPPKLKEQFYAEFRRVESNRRAGG